MPWRLVSGIVQGELVSLQEVDDLIPLFVLVKRRRVFRERVEFDDFADIYGEIRKTGR